MDVDIRPRVDDDLDPLVRLLAAVSRTDGYPSRWPDDPAAWLRTRDAMGAWVAHRDGDLFGHVVLRWPGRHVPVRMWCAASGEDPDACCVVARLFVAAPARGHGVGVGLLEAALTLAVAARRRPVLDVVSTNVAAVRLYRRLGWTHVGDYHDTFGDSGPPELLHCFAGPSPGAGQPGAGRPGLGQPGAGRPGLGQPGSG